MTRRKVWEYIRFPALSAESSRGGRRVGGAEWRAVFAPPGPNGYTLFLLCVSTPAGTRVEAAQLHGRMPPRAAGETTGPASSRSSPEKPDGALAKKQSPTRGVSHTIGRPAS
ncbi:hypothetical protein GCM10020260_13790 [Nesterenkonia halobia]|uniref:Uncharacterized protein n=1 Tax=Nesterenkonia halobia TaxID=37922 RepID=A0ABP6RDQ6_9MICC